MIGDVLKKIFGSQNERNLKRIAPLVDEINGFEPRIRKLSDAELRGKTAEFRQRLENGEELDDLLPEAFAVVREASVAHSGDAALRRPDDRRHCPAPGQDRRNENR